MVFRLWQALWLSDKFEWFTYSVWFGRSYSQHFENKSSQRTYVVYLTWNAEEQITTKLVASSWCVFTLATSLPAEWILRLTLISFSSQSALNANVFNRRFSFACPLQSSESALPSSLIRWFKPLSIPLSLQTEQIRAIFSECYTEL